MTALIIRTAQAADAETVAALHTASWRAHYRGAFSDAYLDGPIAGERLALWRQRLGHPSVGLTVLLAEEGGVLRGFVTVLHNHDRVFGSLIDNLHVALGHQGGGIGRRLMGAAGEALLHAVPQRPVYLSVLTSNRAAQAFYDRIGGTMAEQARETEPDGSELTVLRYTWPSPGALVAGAAPA